MSGAMHQWAHRWQLNGEAQSASMHPGVISTASTQSTAQQSKVAPNRSSRTTTYSIPLPTSLYLFFAFTLFLCLST
jgi:hypothetical protein